jgi:hypothetical protein
MNADWFHPTWLLDQGNVGRHTTTIRQSRRRRMSHIIPKCLFRGPKFFRGGGIVGIVLTGLVSAIAWSLGSELYKRAKGTPEAEPRTEVQ